jgi:hypothetical protein
MKGNELHAALELRAVSAIIHLSRVRRDPCAVRSCF